MKMKNLSKILLLSSPAVISSFFLTVFADKPAQALELESNLVPQNNQATPQSNLDCENTSCTGNNYLAKFDNLVNVDKAQNNQQFPNVKRNQDGDLMLNVTDEESDAAVALFGCDCVKAVNALRQLRGIPIGVEGDRILPGPMIRPCTQRLPEA